MSNAKPAGTRLTFIDVGRALAIILMLQGHFISTTFEGYTTMTAELKSTGASGNVWFDMWCRMRGFTAPLFFTITGVVFAFLLSKQQGEPFFQQKRVRKGIRRGISIILWGYILQLQIKHLDTYLTGHFNTRFYSFHVLQCIGLGILALILLYGIQHLLKRIPFEAILITAGTAVFAFTPFIATGGNGYFPKHAPLIIQNAFYGPNSVFPIFPWFGFIFFGGAIGVLIHKYQHKIGQKGFTLRIVAIGVAFCLSAYALITMVGKGYPDNIYLGRGYWQFTQLAILIIVLGIIMFLTQKTKIKIPFLLAIGQNTLVVYILHVILLYGTIIGVGIKTYYSKSLTFSQSFIGAIGFIVLFGIITMIQPHIIKAVKGIFTKTKQEEKEAIT